MISRIKQLLDWQQLSPTQFADRIGIGRPVVSHILNERNKPSLEVVQRILAAFPELSTAWLLTGAGDMLVTSVPPPAAPSPAPTAPASAALPARPAPASFAAPVELSAASSPAPPAVPPFAPPAVPVGAPAAIPRPATAPPRRPLARFDAGLAATSSPVVTDAPAGAAASVAAAVPAPAPPPVAADPAGPPPAAPAPTAPVGPMAAFAEGLAEPGKAIRRIVIFYRDGSFADYQPEG